MSFTTAASEAEIWNRAIRPEVGDLQAAAARELLRLHVADEDAARVRELSGKANAGTLSSSETEELEIFDCWASHKPRICRAFVRSLWDSRTAPAPREHCDDLKILKVTLVGNPALLRKPMASESFFHPAGMNVRFNQYLLSGTHGLLVN